MLLCTGRKNDVAHIAAAVAAIMTSRESYLYFKVMSISSMSISLRREQVSLGSFHFRNQLSEIANLPLWVGG